MYGTIAIPHSHFSAPYPFIKSLVKFLTETKLNIEVIFKEGALIEDNRNSLLYLAKGDFLIFIDTDMTFTTQDVERLVEQKKDIVCGLYFRGQPPHEPLIIKDDVIVREYMSGLTIEVDACAMGFTYISRNVIEKMKEDLPFKRIDDYGEDISFCKRAKEKGFEIYCDTSIQPKHLRYKYVGENDYQKHL